MNLGIDFYRILKKIGNQDELRGIKKFKKTRICILNDMSKQATWERFRQRCCVRRGGDADSPASGGAGDQES